MKHPRTIVKKLDENLDESAEEFKIAVALVAAAQVGPNADKMAKRSGLPRSLVRSYAARAREEGIFKGGKIACDWFDKDGGIAFWLDVATVRGFLTRVLRPGD